jgi:hypothetical protein
MRNVEQRASGHPRARNGKSQIMVISTFYDNS